MSQIRIKTNAIIGHSFELTLDRSVELEMLKANPIRVQSEKTGKEVSVSLDLIDGQPGMIRVRFDKVVASGWYNVEVPEVLTQAQRRDILGNSVVLGVLKVDA